MYMVMLKQWKLTLPLLLALAIVGVSAVRTLMQPAPAKNSSPDENVSRMTPPVWPLVGTASCSARGCHGSSKGNADPNRCGQNEYTLWAHDRHADAYRVLFSARAQDIIKRLGGAVKAQDDPRCLACHVTPLLAALPQDSPFVQEEKLFGVGCESCHGSANEWLVPHTRRDWRAKKADHAMPDLADPTTHARACVGCHVGAPADADIPLRDVNHDMIAAGHPRLNFEFGSFQANMPPHWRAKEKSEAQLWAAGQLVSAQAALALTAQRARAGPWPEFAEYDCFSCHHALGESGWRREPDRRRKSGTLPWGSWHFALTRDLTGPLPALDDLEKTMQARTPDRKQAGADATVVRAELKSVRLDPERLLGRLKAGTLSLDPSWDSAEQLYLALHVLSPSEALYKLTPERAFASGFDGPLSLPRDGRAEFQPRRFVEKLKGLAK